MRQHSLSCAFASICRRHSNFPGFVQDLENLENLGNWLSLTKVRENLEKSGVFFIFRMSGKIEGILIFDLVVGNSPKLIYPQRPPSDTKNSLICFPLYFCLTLKSTDLTDTVTLYTILTNILYVCVKYKEIKAIELTRITSMLNGVHHENEV